MLRSAKEKRSGGAEGKKGEKTHGPAKFWRIAVWRRGDEEEQVLWGEDWGHKKKNKEERKRLTRSGMKADEGKGGRTL